MAKTFAPRIAKKERKTIDLSDKLGNDYFRFTDRKLLEGAKLAEVHLKEIQVKDQVRTKFNDDTIKELAANIRANGLIQPLVLHREKNGKLTLICGERRFRAMSSINYEKAECVILENKTADELMAIQFSENSAREQLHYIDKADGIYSYQQATNASERKIVDALGISKTEVHRSLIIAKLPEDVKEAAKKYDTEKYVLLELSAIEDAKLKKEIGSQIAKGDIVKRSEIQKAIRTGEVLTSGKKSSAIKRGVSANALLKAFEEKSKTMKLDAKTQDLLKSLMAEAKDIVDM
jgi:ParB family chromosome partitioning protein